MVESTPVAHKAHESAARILRVLPQIHFEDIDRIADIRTKLNQEFELLKPDAEILETAPLELKQQAATFLQEFNSTFGQATAKIDVPPRRSYGPIESTESWAAS